MPSPAANLITDGRIPEAILLICGVRGLCVHLSDCGEHILYTPDIPSWLIDAIRIYEPALVDLMRAGFVRSWARCAQWE